MALVKISFNDPEADPLSITDPEPGLTRPEPITVKMPLEELSRSTSNLGKLLNPSIKILTVNCIDCNGEIETTYSAYLSLVDKLKLPISRFR